MEYSLEELEDALEYYDAQGDTESAQEIASQIQAIMTNPKSVEDVAAEPQSWWDRVNEPNRPEFDAVESGKRVLESTLFGAGIGAVLPPPSTAVIGGAAGFGSGLAGELGRAMGVSDVTRTGMEVGAGLGVEAAPMALKALRGSLSTPAPVVSELAPGARIRTFASGNNIVPERVQEVALQNAQIKLFGKPTFDLNVVPTNFIETQANLQAKYLPEAAIGAGIDPSATVSSQFRGNLYDTIKKQGQSFKEKTVEVSPARRDSLGMLIAPAQTRTVKETDVFYNSPEFKELLNDIRILKKSPKEATGGEVRNLIKTVKNETDPEVVNASEKILNLMQNGGAYIVGKKGGEAETKQLISEPMREALVKRFDQYLERNTGAPLYSQLKEIEKAEFVAKAKDYIPRLLQNSWRASSEEYKAVLNTVKMNPETRVLFGNALIEHIGTLGTTTQMKSELRRLDKVISDSKLLTSQQVRDLFKKITNFDKEFGKQKAYTLGRSLVTSALTGAISAEMANIIEPTSKRPLVTNTLSL